MNDSKLRRAEGTISVEVHLSKVERELLGLLYHREAWPTFAGLAEEFESDVSAAEVRSACRRLTALELVRLTYLVSLDCDPGYYGSGYFLTLAGERLARWLGVI